MGDEPGNVAVIADDDEDNKDEDASELGEDEDGVSEVVESDDVDDR